MLSCDVTVMKPFGRRVTKKWLERVAREVCAAEAVAYPAALGVVITDDEAVRELNRRWRGMDRTTDVLSFSLQEGDAEFPPDPEGVIQLGEVIISLPQAQRQAERRGHSLRQEITLLTVHGILHLLGYDHERPAERKKMRVREAEILSRLLEGNTRAKRCHR